MKIIIKQTYLKYRKMLNAYNEATKLYCKENKTNGIPQDVAKTFPYAKQVNNDMRTKIEIFEFIYEIPTSYFLYIRHKESEAVTWTGEKLGNVDFGKEYRSNMGDIRINIDVHAINGKKYHGVFYKSAGDYARIKIYK